MYIFRIREFLDFGFKNKIDFFILGVRVRYVSSLVLIMLGVDGSNIVFL